ncbi:MAG: PQQ-dependent sugar dehydrogenase [Isosphaeraceae bacterium]
MYPRYLICLLGLALLAASPSSRAEAPDNPIPAPIPQSRVKVALHPIARGLTAPLHFAAAGKRGMTGYIVDQTGLILVLREGGIRPEPFLDITAIMSGLSPSVPGAPPGLTPGYDGRGLLGLAFHPGFDVEGSPGYRTLYTMHNVPVTKIADFPIPPFPDASVVPNCQEVIAEWKAIGGEKDDELVVDPASYREILRFDKPQYNHNGGAIVFGRDRLLYASIGDGGNANDVGPGHNPLVGNAQDLSTILGKILRIDPLNPNLGSGQRNILSDNGQYHIPRSNPFVSAPGSLKEIYAYGLRAPHRMSFDKLSNRLIVGDVGQKYVEEINIITRGGNYGWRHKEGSFLFDPATGEISIDTKPDPARIDPIAEYDHEEFGGNAGAPVAVIGGFVYRGSSIPQLRGKYVFGDLTGVLLVANLYSGKIERLLHTGMLIKGFGQDGEGELYVLGSTSIGPSGTGGAVLAIQRAPRD